MQVEPEVRLMPHLFGGLPRLECHFGWSNEAYNMLKENNFEILVLSGGEGQDFLIPDLGEYAQKVSALRLQASGIVEGLGQFNNTIKVLDITTVPKNSLSIKHFQNIQSLSLEWDKKIEAQIHAINSLKNLFIRYYKYKELDKLQCLRSLKKISFSQGSVSNIEGVNLALESLDLSYLRNYYDVDSINKLTELKWLNCENIKKAVGTIKIDSFKKLTFVSFVGTNCTLDLKNINKLKHLEKIWSNGEHINLNWEDIIPLPNLKLVGLYDSEITDDEIKVIAEKANRKIERLFRAGTKKRPHIQITFEY